MSGVSTILWHDKLQKSQAIQLLRFVFSTTGAALTVVSTTLNYPAIFGTTATPFTIALVNALLVNDSTGAALSTTSTSELATTTMFGSTAMGTDAFGIVVACQGQVKTALWIKGITSGTASSACTSAIKGIDASSPADALASALWKTPAGNVAARLVISGLDALTGFLDVEIAVVVK